MQRQTIDDAVLDIRIHHARGSRLRAVASLAFGRDVDRLPAGACDSCRRTPISSASSCPISSCGVSPEPGAPSVYVHDGELEEEAPGGWTLRCAIVPDALEVYAPAPASDG